ncbi:MAG: type I glutamate--ammonia ligase, partial [Intestinibacter sp.]
KEEDMQGVKRLPEDLNKAIEVAKNSEFLKEVLPKKTIDNYINDKMEEWNIYSSVTDKFKAEKQLYFEKL